MATWWETLSETGRENWERLYKRLKRKKWEVPTKDERGITCETEMEDIPEIVRLMRQKPNPTRRE